MSRLVPASFLLLLGTSLLRAGLPFVEDFESHPVGKPLPVGEGRAWTSNNDNNNRHAKVRAQAFRAFGEGKYLVVDQARASGGPLVLGANGALGAGATAVEVAMDVRVEAALGSGVAFFLGAEDATTLNPGFPKLDEASGQVGPRWRGYLVGLQFNGAVLGANTRRDHGPVTAAFPTGRSVALRLVANNGTTVISYGEGTVAPGRYDLFVDGVLVADDREGEGGVAQGVPLTSFSFVGNNAGKPPLGSLFVDNLTIRAVGP